jgi:hypothetical protein
VGRLCRAGWRALSPARGGPGAAAAAAPWLLDRALGA